MNVLNSSNFLASYQQNDKNLANDFIKQTAKSLGIDTEHLNVADLHAKDFSNAMYQQSFEASITQFSFQMQLSNGSSFSLDFLQIEAKYSASIGNEEALKQLHNLNPQKAKELISEDGYFGIKQTAERISGFVLNGAGDDLNKLQAGRAGVLKGLDEAFKLLGGLKGEAKDLAQSTIDKALEAIDKKISKLDGHVLDIKA